MDKEGRTWAKVSTNLDYVYYAEQSTVFKSDDKGVIKSDEEDIIKFI